MHWIWLIIVGAIVGRFFGERHRTATAGI